MKTGTNVTPTKNTAARSDLGIIGLVSVLVFVLASTFNLFEKFAKWAEKHDQWQTDDIVPVFVVLSLALGVFSWRRWRELHLEVGLRKQAEQGLVQANAELESRVRERTGELKSSNQQLQHELGERSQAEEALRVSEQRYRQIVDHANDIIYKADALGCFTFCNPTTSRLLKYADEELIGMHFLELVAPGYRNDTKSFYAQQFVNRTLNTYYEFPAITKSGTEIWFGQNVQLLIASERVVGFQAVARDITERKQAEDALRQAEEYRNLFRLANDPILIFDADGIVLDVNDKGCATYGIAREEFVGRSLFAMSQDVAFAQRQFEAFVTEEEPLQFETVQLRGDGTPLHFNINASVIEYQGRRAVLSINRDVTERKRAEAEHLRLEEQFRQSQKMEAVGQLAGGVAHDFNNLITVVNGYCELILRRPELDASVVKSVEEIRKAGNRAASLTRQLLAFSRRQVLQPKVLDLNLVVGDMDQMLRRLIGEDIDLVTVLNPELGQIKADPGQMEQVLMNLIVNARDAMSQGGKITIETQNVVLNHGYAGDRTEVTPGPYVLLAVSDSGVGIDVATQALIFDPFFTTKEVGTGTGLGLSTVFGIVKQSDGDVRVYSEPGIGTTFKIYLPRVDEIMKTETSTHDPIETPTGKETILLVEDEEIVRSLARHILEASGYTVMEAAGGHEALQICRGHDGPLDLILTDVIMPQMSGPSVVKEVAVMRPIIKALYMSGYTNNAVLHHGVLEGEISFLQKPFTPAALVLKVREVLDAVELLRSSSVQIHTHLTA